MKKKFAKTIIVILILCCCSITVFAVAMTTHPVFANFFREYHRIVKQNDEVLISVNDEPIYKSSVDIQLQFNELANSLAKDKINGLNISDMDKHNMLVELENNRKTEEDILNDLIRTKVVMQEAKKIGIVVTKETAEKVAIEQYTTLKQEASSGGVASSAAKNYAFIQAFIDEKRITEKEYLKLLTECYQELLTMDKFYEATQRKLKLENTSKENVDLHVKQYIDKLVDSAQISQK